MPARSASARIARTSLISADDSTPSSKSANSQRNHQGRLSVGPIRTKRQLVISLVAAEVNGGLDEQLERPINAFQWRVCAF